MALAGKRQEMSNKDWSAYFDSQLAAGVEVNTDMGSGHPRIRGADGRWHTRSGAGCCGCGKHRDCGHPNYGWAPVIPASPRSGDKGKSGDGSRVTGKTGGYRK